MLVKGLLHATEKWQAAAGDGGALCSVHCHLNGRLFMSRQRARKVTTKHARIVPDAAGEGGHGGLEKGIVREHKAKR